MRFPADFNDFVVLKSDTFKGPISADSVRMFHAKRAVPCDQFIVGIATFEVAKGSNVHRFKIFVLSKLCVAAFVPLRYGQAVVKLLPG